MAITHIALAGCLLTALLVPANSIFGQGTTAQIRGRVTDSSGALIEGVQVTATNTETNTQAKTRSNLQGEYAIPALQPGKYLLSAGKLGFRPVVRSGITLEVDQVASIDFVLQVGDVKQEVNVVAAAPLLATTNPHLGEVVNNVQVENLPLNGRQPFRLLQLTPGTFAAPSSNGQFQDIPVNQGNESIFSIGGGRARSNEVLIDGIPTTVGPGNTLTVIPPVDATQEFDVLSGPLKAEWGRSGGGVVNVYTKSGSNQLHGSLFDFLRNDKLDANDFFDNKVGAPRPAFRLNQFGFAVGGPVYIPKVYKGTNKTFFFADYQGTRWRQGSTFFATLPTALERQGNFTETRAANGGLVTIFNPFSTRSNPDSPGQSVRDALPGNILPASLLDPVSRKVLDYVPMPNLGGNQFTHVNNYISNANRAINETDLGVRIDRNITAREAIFGRLAINRNALVQPNTFGTVASPGEGALGTLHLNGYNGGLHSTTTLSPTSVLTASLGWARWEWFRPTLSFGFNQAQLGFPESLVKQFQFPLFPTFNVEGYSNFGGGSGLQFVGQDTFSLLASLTKIMGRHTLKYGVDIRLLRDNLLSGNAAGTFGFQRRMTAGPNPNLFSLTAGSGFASYLLGTGNSGNVNLIAGSSLQHYYYAGYIQDDFHVATRLTLNFGLRYETTSPANERRNQLNWFDFNLPSPARNSAFLNLTGGLQFASPQNRTVYDWDFNNWSPRLGFAYNVVRNMVIRGGIGLTYSALPISIGDTGFSPNSGFYSTTPFLGTLDGLSPFNLLRNPIPEGLVQPAGASLGAGTFLGQGVQAWQAHPLTPAVWQWNLSIQRETKGFLFDIAYVGLKGTHLNQPREFNALPPADLALGSALQQLVNNPFYGIITTGALAQRTVTRRQLLLPFPQFTSVSVINDTSGNSSYNAMELRVKKPLTRGVSLLMGYTASKLFSDVSNTITNNGNPHDRGLNASVQDPYNLRAERSVSEMDVPNYLTVSAVAELPFGPNRALLSRVHGVPARLVQGWQVSSIFKYVGGFPLSFSAPIVGGGNRPNRTCSGRIEGSRTRGQKIDEWFDTSCFPVPAPFSFGNDSRTNPDVRGPSFTQTDFSLEKANKLWAERARLILRAEAFNILNTPHFNPPQLNAGANNFGQIFETIGMPRVIQLALKLTF